METLQQYWGWFVIGVGVLAVGLPLAVIGWHKLFGTDAPLWLSRVADFFVWLAGVVAQRDAKTVAVVAAGATAEIDDLAGKLPEGIRDTAKLLVIQHRTALEADLKKLLSK